MAATSQRWLTMNDSNEFTRRRLIDKHAVCEVLGCGPTYVWLLVQRGRLTPIRLGHRMTRYDAAEVQALADELIEGAKAQRAAA